MNINDVRQSAPDTLNDSLAVSQAASVNGVQSQQRASSTGTAAGFDDRTELSTAASLANHAMSVSDVRMDKVAAMQQALANGSYQVSAADVAGKLLNHMMSE
jgi:negative regulator of flagellin synthesis FlgM